MRILLTCALLAMTVSPALAVDDFDRIYVAKNTIKEMLKDPDSAEFKDVFVKAKNHNGKTLHTICGSVNSKNSFGGYTGYQKFVTNGISVSALESQVSDFPKLWNTLCAG